ncbi:hypothetical protein ACFR9U_14605 [Halorientalis brevis]|uniref:Uncharacterized protein n=1 Tax=Halorientalis brevis TaxID=1126241 RepID=A0ABD6CD75_9EURY|nr:hypothetical protein [Halorientalis brevis]
MNCRVEARHRAHNAVNELEAVPAVIGVDVIAPSVDPTDQWTLELTLRTDGVPAVVNSILGEYGLTLKHAGPRSDWWHGMAVVEQ